jgi:hypothetical protein
MNYAIEMASGGVIYIPSFIMIGSGIQIIFIFIKYEAKWPVTVLLHLFNGLPRLLFPCGL